MCVGATAMQKTNHSAAVKDKRWAMEALNIVVKCCCDSKSEMLNPHILYHGALQLRLG